MNPISDETIADVTIKLIGSITPVGETHTDDMRLRNLQVLENVMNILLDEILLEALPAISRDEFSMRRSGRYAFRMIEHMRDVITDAIMEYDGDYK